MAALYVNQPKMQTHQNFGANAQYAIANMGQSKRENIYTSLRRKGRRPFRSAALRDFWKLRNEKTWRAVMPVFPGRAIRAITNVNRAA
jgi:hypothetical protein